MIHSTSRPDSYALLCSVALAVLLTAGSAGFNWSKRVFSSDSPAYIKIADGQIHEVPRPYSNRILLPLAVRALKSISGLDTDRAFYIVGLASAFVLATTVSWLVNSAARHCLASLPILLTPYWFALTADYYIVDCFHAALLGLFVVTYQRRPTLSLGLLLLLFLARESTVLLSAVVIVVWLKHAQKRQAALAAATTLIALGLVWCAAQQGQSNIHKLNPVVYLILKVPFNFCHNVLGLRLWTNTLRVDFGPPIWTWEVPAWLRLGSIRTISYCGHDLNISLRTLTDMLTMFGIAPAVLLAIMRRQRVGLFARYPSWVIVVLIYGLIAFVSGPMLGLSISRLVGYGWPAFWIAAPVMLLAGPSGPGRNWLALLVCHVVVCWLPRIASCLIDTHTASAMAGLIITAIALDWIAYRIERERGHTTVTPDGPLGD